MLLVYIVLSVQQKPPSVKEGMLDYFTVEQYLQTIPTTQGRYVRIRPGTAGDGRLTISQVQVLDMNGNNIALKMPVTGSPSLAGSADISVTVDGTTSPRTGASKVWTTSGTGSSQYWQVDLGNVYQISQVIFSGQSESAQTATSQTLLRTKGMSCIIAGYDGTTINTIETFPAASIYQTITFPNSINITPTPTGDAVGLLNPIMIPLNSAQPEVFLVTGSYTQQQTEIACGLLGAVVATTGQVSTAQSNGAIWSTPGWAIVSNQKSKEYILNNPTASGINTPSSTTSTQAAVNCFGIKPANGTNSTITAFNSNTWTQYVNNTVPTNYGGTTIVIPDVVKLYATIGTPTTPTAVSTITSSQLSAINSTISIFGTMTAQATSDFNSSLDLSKKIFLGSDQDVNKYINISTSDFKPYIRTSIGGGFCAQEVIQSISKGDYVFNLSTANINTNASTCNTAFTSDMMGLLPSPTRDYIQIWIYNRIKRFVQYKLTASTLSQTDLNNLNLSSLTPTTDINTINNSIRKMYPTVDGKPVTLDITNNYILDKIAQAFYEAMGGNYTMTQIYDVSTIGGTIVDIRFDLTKHADISTIQAQLADIRAKYYAIRESNVTQDILDSAKINYENATATLQATQSSNILPPVTGVVGRFFYKYSTDTQAFSITGFTLDSRAVTSFIPELNCGIQVPTGNAAGAINYVPTTVYTKNVPEALSCTSSLTLRKIIDDYIDLTQSELQPILRGTTTDNGKSYKGVGGAPSIDTTLGTVHVNQIIGAVQISPTQCAIKWKETLWNDASNQPISPALTNITRRALFSYVVNTEDWYSNTINIDPSGIIFYSTDSVPACKLDTVSWKNTASPRLDTSTTAEIQKDFMENGWNNGIGLLCPADIPNYIFNAQDYCAANTTLKTTCYPSENGQLDSAAAKKHYTTTGSLSGLTVRTTQAITPLPAPIVIEQPLPANNILDTLNGVCPATTCEDRNVLYSLVDQYNTDPSKAGSILRVTRAFTASPYQCDVEVDINYNVTGINGAGKTVVKGSFTYDSNGNEVKCTNCPPTDVSGAYSGVTLALFTGTNVADCTFSLNDAGGRDSGTTIQTNTPLLYKPMDYATFLSDINVPSISSSFDAITGAITDAATSATSLLTSYRGNTVAAVGSIATLGTGCTAKCSDTAVINNMLAYYKSQVNRTKQINTVLRMGTLNSTTCDMTYQEDTLAPSGTAYKVVSSQTAGMRFTLAPDTAACTFKTTAMDSILPGAPPSAALDMSKPPSSAVCSEVYGINSTTLTQQSAAAKCVSYGGVLATEKQLAAVATAGANWAVKGFLLDLSGVHAPTGTQVSSAPTQTLGGAICYGVKPAPGKYSDVLHFTGSQWNQPGTCATIINYVNPSKEAFINYGTPVQVSESTFPLNTKSFGLDMARNRGGPALDTLYEEPLRAPHRPTETYGPRDVGDESLLQPGKGPSYKYIRFKPLKTRDPAHPTVEIGKFRFLIGLSEVDMRFAKVTNPMGTWVGDLQDVVGGGFRRGFSDAHKKPIIFAFPYAMLMNGFTWTTANPDKGVGGDPVQWKLEGSQNGTFWTTLRDQTRHNYPVPSERYQELPVFRF